MPDNMAGKYDESSANRVQHFATQWTHHWVCSRTHTRQSCTLLVRYCKVEHRFCYITNVQKINIYIVFEYADKLSAQSFQIMCRACRICRLFHHWLCECERACAACVLICIPNYNYILKMRETHLTSAPCWWRWNVFTRTANKFPRWVAGIV